MERKVGIWTAIRYKDEVVDPSLDEADPRKRRPTIYLWVRDLEGKRHRLVIRGFRPYFYVLPSIISDAPEIFQMPEVEEYTIEEFGKRKLAKVYTYVPGQVKKLRKILQKRFAQAVVREGDVLFELRYLIDKGIRGAVDFTDPSNPVPISEDLNIKLRRVYLDTEVWAKRTVEPGHMSSHEYLKCITAYDSYEKKYYTWYCEKFPVNVKGDKDWIIKRCTLPSKMVVEFLEWLAERDPDVITGYNVDFDLLNIRQEVLRGDSPEKLSLLSALHDLGYTIAAPVTKKHRIRGVDWSRKGLILDGREVIDILDCVRMISRSQLKSYTLDFIAKTFLGEEGKVTYNGIPVAANIQTVWEKSPQTVLEYNKHDVELLVKLDEQYNLIDFLDELRKAVGVRLEDAFSNQRMIDTEALRRRTFPLPSKFSKEGKEDETYKGALVVNPIPGLHEWVVCLDYKSLYPTIIRTFNIDTDTYVVEPKFLKSKDDVYIITNPEETKTWMFLKQPRGLFPAMLDDFVALRDSLQKQLAKETDPVKKKLLDIKQEVVKVLSNAVYGSFGYRSRKHNLEVAEAVTSFGQRMIKLAAQVATELGFQVIYGDTDSIFIRTGANNYGEAYNAGVFLQDKIMERIPSYLGQFNVSPGEPCLFSIKLEKVYDRFYMAIGKKGKATKKRYCGRIILKEGGVKFETKGLDLKRSDTSDFAGHLQKTLLEGLLSGKKKEELVDYVVQELNKIDTYPLEYIGVPSAISKPLERYEGNPIQKRAAVNSNTFLGTKFEYGDKPLRVYIKIPEREKVFPRSYLKTEAEQKDLETLLSQLDVIAFDNTTKIPEWVEVDYPRMVQLTVKPKIEPILEFMELKWEQIEEKLKPELRKEKKTRKKKKLDKTLDMFFGGNGT